MTLGTPLVRLPVAGLHVAVDRRRRLGGRHWFLRRRL